MKQCNCKRTPCPHSADWGKPLEIPCDFCGRVKLVAKRKYIPAKTHFCNRICHRRYQKGKKRDAAIIKKVIATKLRKYGSTQVSLICERCKKIFKRFRARARSKLIFCSNFCFGKYRIAHPEVYPPTMLGKKHSPKIIARLKRLAQSRWRTGIYHGTPCSPQRRDNIIKAKLRLTAYQWADIARKRNSTWVKNGRKFGYIFGYRADLGHICRSALEANYCRFLKWIGEPYEYEPKSFDLKYGIKTLLYTPDLYLPDRDVWVELKGYLRPLCKIRLQLFKEQYPRLNFNVVLQSEVEWKDINKHFSKLIPMWEK